MNNKKDLPISTVSDLEQFEAMLVNFAPMVGSYHQALLKNRIPESLAGQLVVEWHKLYWENVLKKAGK